MRFISSIIVLARTLITVLSGDSEYSCLIPDLRGKVFSLLALSMMLAMRFFCLFFVCVLWIPFTRLRKFSFIPSFLSVVGFFLS